MREPTPRMNRPGISVLGLPVPWLFFWIGLAATVTSLSLVVAACSDSSTAPDEEDLMPPDGVAVQPMSISSMRLRWTPVTGDGVVSYRIERRVDLEGPFETLRDVSVDQVVAGDSLARFEDTGLEPETFYGYRVRSVGFLGGVSGPSVVGGARTPLPPSIRVFSRTVAPNPGSADPDGYTVAVTGPESREVEVGANASVLLKDLMAGTYQVSLEGLAENCLVEDPQREATVTDQGLQTVTEVRFNITCKDPSRGEIHVAVVSRGTSLPQNPNRAVVSGLTDGGEGVSREATLLPTREPGATADFLNLLPGDYEVALQEVDLDKCEVVGDDVVQGIQVEPLSSDTVRFEVLCGEEDPGDDANLLVRWVDIAGRPITAAAPGDRVRLQVCSTEDLEVAQGKLRFSPSLLSFEQGVAFDASAASGVHPDCRGEKDLLDDTFQANAGTSSVAFLVLRVEEEPNVGTVGIGEFVFQVEAEGKEFISFEELLGTETGGGDVELVADAAPLLIDPDSVETNQPPVAEPGGPYTATQGTAFQLDGTGSSDPDGSVTRYDWDFGDGNLGSDAGPTPDHTYQSTGTFTIRLTVTDDQGATGSDTTTVTVADTGGNQSPTADPGGPYTATVGEALTLDGSGSSDSDGSVTRYDWEFGDGTSAENAGATPTHTYESSGTFTVTLTVTDDSGATDEAGTSVSVSGDGSGPNVLVRWVAADGTPVGAVQPGETVRAHVCALEPTLENFQAQMDFDADGGGELSYERALDLDSDGQGVFGPNPDNQQPHPDCLVSDTSRGSEDLLDDQFQENFVHDTLTKVNFLNQRSELTAENGSPVGVLDIVFTAQAEGRVDENDIEWDVSIFNGTDGVELTATFHVRPLIVSSSSVLDQEADPGGPYNGDAGVPVQFDGSGSFDPDGGSLSFDWVFGDGGTAVDAGPKPTHTYGSAGSYSVELTVSDDEGVSATASTTVTIGGGGGGNQSPVAEAGGPYSGGQGAPIAFNGSGSQDPDGSITRYDWDFGDGTTAADAGPQTTHAYESSGSFTVTLTVTDDAGATASDQAAVTVSPPEPPFALRNRWVQDTVEFGETVLLEVHANPGAPLRQVLATLDWNPQPVRFDSIRSGGFAPLVTELGRVAVGELDYQATAPEAAPGGVVSAVAQIFFTAQERAGPVTTASSNVRLRDDSLEVIPIGTLGIIEDTIHVLAPNQPPVADAGGPYTGWQGGFVAFDGGASQDPDGEISTYDWTFLATDTTTASGAQVEKAFPVPGEFQLLLTVTDDRGASSSDTTTVTISANEAPLAVANGPYQGVAGADLSFTASGSTDPDGSIESFDWDFGDGETGSGPAPLHTYAQQGSYTVVLIVTDDRGRTGTDSTTAIILGNEAPWAEANGPYDAVVGEEVAFTASGSIDNDGSIQDFRWNFGDGTVGTGPAPLHAYTTIGTFQALLTVTDDKGGTGVDSAEVVIREPLAYAVKNLWTNLSASRGPQQAGPTVEGPPAYAGPGDQVELLLTTKPGEGATLSSFSVRAQWNGSLLRYVSAEGGSAWDAGFSATPGGDVGELKALDLDGTAAVAVSGSESVVLARLVFTVLGLEGQTTSSRTSEVTLLDGDGVAIGLDLPLIEGPLIIREGGDNEPPSANAGGPYEGQVGVPVQFIGGAWDTDGEIVRWDWDFGDGSVLVDAGAIPTHVYQAPGTYYATLKVTDDDGATGTGISTVTVAAAGADQPPVAVITGPSTAVVGQEVAYNALGSSDPDGGSIVSYAWSFSDGASGTGLSVNHTFQSAGSATVSLTVTDDEGDAHTTVDTVTVSEAGTDQPPVAVITGPSSATVGQEVSFSGAGSSDPDGGSIVSYAWSFSDGATGSGLSVSHTFQSTGSATVSLTVTDDEGDTHTVTQTVEVEEDGPEPNLLVRWVALDGTPISSATVGERIRVHVCALEPTLENFQAQLDFDQNTEGELSYVGALDLDSDGQGTFGENPASQQPHPDCAVDGPNGDTSLGTDDLLDDQFQENNQSGTLVNFLNQRSELGDENAAPVGVLDIVFDAEVAGTVDASDLSWDIQIFNGTNTTPITPILDIASLTITSSEPSPE